MTTVWVYSRSQWTQTTTHLLLNCYATLCSRKGGFLYVKGLGGGGGPGPAFPLLFYDTAPHSDILSSPRGVLLGILGGVPSRSPNPDPIFQTKKCYFSHSF